VWREVRRNRSGGFALVDEGLEAVGKVAGQRLQQTGGLDQRSLQCASELGEQHFAGRQFGEGFDVLGGQRDLAERTTLEDQQRVGLGDVAERLGGRGNIALDERDAGRADEQLFQTADACVAGGA
jgi:hypothetical protein